MWLSTYASLHPNPIGTLGCGSVRLRLVERKPLSRPFLCRYKPAEVCNGSTAEVRVSHSDVCLRSNSRRCSTDRKEGRWLCRGNFGTQGRVQSSCDLPDGQFVDPRVQPFLQK